MQTNEVASSQYQQASDTQPISTPISQQPGDVFPSTQELAQGEKSNKWLITGLMAFALVALGIAGIFAYQNYQLKKQIERPSPGQEVIPTKTLQPTPTSPISAPSPTPTIDPTVNWETYSNDEYTFKYPKSLKSDTGATGQGFESIRVQFLGPKQVRTQTSLIDGYAFIVTKVDPNTSKTAQRYAQEERVKSEENCGFDQSTISSISQTRIAGTSASQYSVTKCFGDYTANYLVKNGNLYSIIQLYTGEEPEKQNYKSITEQILSTFKFID